MDIGVLISSSADARAAITAGRAAFDGPQSSPAELYVSDIATEASVLGAFQRGHGAPEGELVRRVSGGTLVHVGPGTLHVLLALATPSTLFPCDATKLVNRYVRPLLKALTKSGAPAAYFGRDWISVGHRPSGAVGFAHDARRGRSVFEAFVAIRAPFADARPSFLGKEPGTLESICGRAFDSKAIADAVTTAYLGAAGGHALKLVVPRLPPTPSADELRLEPPWVSRVPEAIGLVCAGPDASGVLRLGGDFMASTDAVEEVETAVGALGPGATLDELGRAVENAFHAGGRALEGVRDLASVRDALRLALQNRA